MKMFVPINSRNSTLVGLPMISLEERVKARGSITHLHPKQSEKTINQREREE